MIKKRIKYGIIILFVVTIAAGAWFARPVSICTLMKNPSPDTIVVNVRFGDILSQRDIMFTAGTPEMDALMEHLDAIRFHRSPLEPLLRLIPFSFGSSHEFDPEKDYQIDFSTFDKSGEFIQRMQFLYDDWSYGTYNDLPLYVFKGQEKGRELGAWLWEMAQEGDSVS